MINSRRLLETCVVAVCLAVTPACVGARFGEGTTTEPEEGSGVATHLDRSLTTRDGTMRTYHLYLPANLGQDSVPLLVALHGGTGWGEQFEANSGFDDLADVDGFIVVYPDGSPIGNTNRRVWNGGNCCGPASDDNLGIDDVGFISDLIETLESQYEIDPNRVFATGHSNGAIMSYRLACELSQEIAGVAFQAGSLEIDECDPSLPVSVLHIHGDADENLPIDGGVGNGISRIEFNSPRDSVETMAQLNGCPEGTETTDPDNSDLTLTIWQPCDGGTTVEMLVVHGAAHPWMGHASPLPNLMGPAYMDFDSSAAVWEFLQDHPRS